MFRFRLKANIRGILELQWYNNRTKRVTGDVYSFDGTLWNLVGNIGSVGICQAGNGPSPSTCKDHSPTGVPLPSMILHACTSPAYNRRARKVLHSDGFFLFVTFSILGTRVWSQRRCTYPENHTLELAQIKVRFLQAAQPIIKDRVCWKARVKQSIKQARRSLSSRGLVGGIVECFYTTFP